MVVGMALFSCKKEKQLPMDEEKFIKILCDIHIAESGMDVLIGAAKDTAATKLYEQIYSIHQVDKAAVDSSLAFIKRNPKEAEKLYARVNEELEILKSIDD